jgi:putative hydrolase of the HAD superfamily
VIEAIVFDFGGVLTSPLEASFRFWSEKTGVPLERLGGALSAIAAREGEHPLFRLERGEISEAAFLAGLGAELGGVDMGDFARTYFDHLEPNDELLGHIRGWHDLGLRLALCTNNVREWEPHWRAMLPIAELFETIVDSAFEGVRKPEPRIYEIVLERLGDVPASDCLFVDDIDVNVQAARELGFHGIHFRSNEQAIPEIEEALGDRL